MGGQVLKECQQVSVRERAGEYLMMRLRTTMGIDPKEYEKLHTMPFAPLQRKLEQFAKQGLAACTYDGRWYLTPEGMLLSNTIISDLLIIQDETAPLG